VVTLTIDDEGNAVFLKSHGADLFCSIGSVKTQRGSHVEPKYWPLRIAFHVIRLLVKDDSRVAQWTREWWCMWRVNLAPVNGPVVGYWRDRMEAIAFEINYLNNFFLEGNI
jgi:hypothetical protein